MSELADLYLQNLQNKPSYSKDKSFLWADFLELLCLANVDNQLSQQDVFDRFAERERDLFEGDTEDIEDLAELEKEENEMPARRSEISDKWEIDLSNWFKVLQYRQGIYKDAYPFEISENEVRRKDNKITLQQKLYLYLLICSNLYLLDRSTRVKLTSCFEIVSLDAFKNFLPNHAEVHLFGVNPLNKSGRYSSGTLWQKINKLSDDLNESLDPRLSQSSYPSSNTGDGGLDLVGWIPTGDKLPSSLIYFAQCACTEDWVSKQDSSSHNSWSGKISFKNHINNSIFIPFCFRTADGNWFKIADIRQSFLIDRKRLLHYYLQTETISFNDLPANEIVEKIINAREDVF